MEGLDGWAGASSRDSTPLAFCQPEGRELTAPPPHWRLPSHMAQMCPHMDLHLCMDAPRPQEHEQDAAVMGHWPHPSTPSRRPCLPGGSSCARTCTGLRSSLCSVALTTLFAPQ